LQNKTKHQAPRIKILILALQPDEIKRLLKYKMAAITLRQVTRPIEDELNVAGNTQKQDLDVFIIM